MVPPSSAGCKGRNPSTLSFFIPPFPFFFSSSYETIPRDPAVPAFLLSFLFFPFFFLPLFLILSFLSLNLAYSLLVHIFYFLLICFPLSFLLPFSLILLPFSPFLVLNLVRSSCSITPFKAVFSYVSLFLFIVLPFFLILYPSSSSTFPFLCFVFLAQSHLLHSFSPLFLSSLFCISPPLPFFFSSSNSLLNNTFSPLFSLGVSLFHSLFFVFFFLVLLPFFFLLLSSIWCLFLIQLHL